MAELTKAALTAAVTSYVDASKQADSTFTVNPDSWTNTVCKIGEMVTLYIPEVDKLPELSGNNLPYGEIIEEYFVNDFLPTEFTYEDGIAKKNAPRVTFAEATYSYPLKEQLFETAVPQTQLQRVSKDSESYAGLVSTSFATMDSSVNAWNYATKRQLLGNMIAKAEALTTRTDLVDTMSKPADTASGEKFIQRVLECIEDASDMNESNLAGHTCAAAPSLTLYVSKKVIPSIKVNTLSGAINKEELAIPCKVKTVLDFGSDTSAFAILVDDRAIKLKDDINYVSADYDGREGVNNMYRHLKQTGFISKYGYVHVFKISE